MFVLLGKKHDSTLGVNLTLTSCKIFKATCLLNRLAQYKNLHSSTPQKSHDPDFIGQLDGRTDERLKGENNGAHDVNRATYLNTKCYAPSFYVIIGSSFWGQPDVRTKGKPSPLMCEHRLGD